MLENVYAPVMLFLFARVHIQSAYHSEQTHLKQFSCITSGQFNMGVYGVLYGEARDPTANTSVCDVVWPWWSLVCGDVCHLYSLIHICYARTLPLALLDLFLILSIFLHAVTQKKRLECFTPLAWTAVLRLPRWRTAVERWGYITWGLGHTPSII